ncbi:hypothetical protein BGX29_008634 [Mortierella sp. GBA35]|nr:hypothetical protein BGX29_008634 [Mortierella sp. GBA35]
MAVGNDMQQDDQAGLTLGDDPQINKEDDSEDMDANSNIIKTDDLQLQALAYDTARDYISRGSYTPIRRIEAVFLDQETPIRRLDGRDPNSVRCIGWDPGQIIAAFLCVIERARGQSQDPEDPPVTNLAIRSSDLPVPGAELTRVLSQQPEQEVEMGERKAKLAELDMAAETILRLCIDEPVVLAIGNGSFRNGSKLTSKHAALKDHAAKKAIAKGHLVVLVNEICQVQCTPPVPLMMSYREWPSPHGDPVYA